MANHESLVPRLCEASEGSADLSREVREALGGRWSANEPCITTSLSAAWEEAERRGLRPSVMARADGCKPPYFADVIGASGKQWADFGNTPALALCAALLAAEGER